MHVPVVFLSFGFFIHTQVLGRMEMAFSPLFQSTDWITLLAILLPLLLCVGVLVCCYYGPKTYTVDPVDLQAVLETKGGGGSSSSRSSNSRNSGGKRSLEIIVLTIGTRGDVQPFVALCKGLKRAGHRPRIASHGCFKAWVEGEGIAFKDIGSERINQPDEWLTAKNIKDFFMAMKPEMVKSKLACEAFYKESKGMDLILCTSHTVSFGLDISEKLALPCYVVKLAPDLPTRAFGPFSKGTSSFGWINLLNHYSFLVEVGNAYKEAGMDTMEDEFRKNVLGLKDSIGMKRLQLLRDMPTIVAVGKDIIPDPQWQRNVAVCGWLFLDNEAFSPPPDVVKFLNGPGGPPVCVNFGSMVLASEANIILNSVKAARKLGYRVLLITGWGKAPECDLFEDADNCMLVKGLPHEWIFPQCRCIVHHGGAGTTARALQSGVPSVIVPILKWADQTFWARRVEAADCGLHAPDPSQEKLEAAIDMVCTSASVRRGCEAMKRCVGNETGLETAVEMIETAWDWSEQERNA